MITTSDATTYMFSKIAELPKANNLFVSYPDVEARLPPDSNWIRVSIDITSGNQISLADERGSRKWGEQGILYIQVFTQVNKGDLYNQSFANKFVSLFRGERGEILFFNCYRKVVGRDGSYYQSNVIIEFKYENIE